jgi:hypothetical protein
MSANLTVSMRLRLEAKRIRPSSYLVMQIPSAPYNCGQEARRLTPSARVARSKVDGCWQIQLVDQNIKYSILDTTCSCGSGNKRRMTVKEKLVATLPPLGFIVDGHTEEFDFCCEDVNGYDCLLTLELHPNFLYAVAFVFPSPQSPDSVEFDIEFPLTVTAEEIYRWVFDCSKRFRLLKETR